MGVNTPIQTYEIVHMPLLSHLVIFTSKVVIVFEKSTFSASAIVVGFLSIPIHTSTRLCAASVSNVT